MNELLKLIKNYQKIIIHRHISPDGDALASQIGLKEIIKFNFPEKNVYSVGDKIPNYLSTIFQNMDLIEDSIFENALVIIVDTANIERISDDRWSKGKEIVKIDHHVTKGNFAKLNIVDSESSSCAEIIFEFFKKNTELKINEKIATILLLGIITDTGRFLHQNTTKKTLNNVYELLNLGADLQYIYKNIYRESKNSIKFQGYLLKNFNQKDKVSYIILKKNIEKKFKLDYSEVSSKISTIMNIENVLYSLYASWDKNEKLYKISLRSKDKPINKIAENYGGGGHKNASGIKVKNKKKIKQILEELQEL